MKKTKGFQQSLPESHKVPKSTAATQTPPHQPRPTVQKKPVTDSSNEDQFFKLVSPPKPTIHLHPRKSTKTLQQTLNLVKNHQKFSKAVDGQKTKGSQAKNKCYKNQVSVEEIKKVVAEAIELEKKRPNQVTLVSVAINQAISRKNVTDTMPGCKRKESKQQNLNG